MASRSALAARVADTNDDIDASMANIAESLGIEVPDTALTPRGKDPEIRAVVGQERIAAFLKLVEGKLATEAPDADEEAADAIADEAPDAEEEPTFHGQPLTFYDGMSDDEILDIKGIGKKILAEIRSAQAAKK